MGSGAGIVRVDSLIRHKTCENACSIFINREWKAFVRNSGILVDNVLERNSETINPVSELVYRMKDKELKLEHTGFDINEEHPVFYKSTESKPTDFYIIHVYTPEHFTLLRYMDVAGIVTTHFSTVNSKYELVEMITKGIHGYKQLRVISREEYLNLKNTYDNYIKSIHV